MHSMPGFTEGIDATLGNVAERTRDVDDAQWMNREALVDF
jgi:hypothetical protein